MRQKLRRLIERGKEIKVNKIPTTASDYAQWNQDVSTFNERVLKKHPANKGIFSALFFCHIDSVLGRLKSVYDDEDFWAQAGTENKIEVKELSSKTSKYDVFLSHANADKVSFVDELKVSLDKLGVNVFYDKSTIIWGDKWKDVIFDGVEKAEFAIVVISENFFEREWTEKELFEFLNRQNRDGQKIVLPILHGITIAQLKEKYPSVAEIQAIDSNKYSCDEIALMFASILINQLKLQSM